MQISERESDFTLTANGTAGPYVHRGGSLTVQAVGTWGGGSIAVQMDLGGGVTTVYTLTSTDPHRILDLPPNADVFFVLSGATSPNLRICCR